MTHLQFATILAATGGIFCAAAQAQAGADYGTVREAIRARLQKALDQGGTSVSYAILRNGEPVLSDAVGYLDSSRQARVNTGTLYNIGSISKVFTAMAVLQLAESGKIGLDDPVVKHLPDFRLNDKRYAGITIRMLLNHSAGMMGADYTSIFMYGSVDSSYREYTMDYWTRSPLKADPGKFSVYCNDCFTAAQFLVEQVSGERFPDYVKRHIFEPLGMATSSFADHIFGPGTHAGYIEAPQEFINALGSGGVAASLPDLARFGNVFLRGGAPLLTAASTGEMSSPQGKTFIAEDKGSPKFGLGWDQVGDTFDDVDLGSGVLSKNGGTDQFISQLYVVPEYNLVGAISATNDYAGDVLAELRAIIGDVLRAQGIEARRPEPVYPAPQKAPLPAGFESEYAGYYGAGYAMLIRMEVNGDQTIRLQVSDGETFYPYEEGLVFDGRILRRGNGEPAYRFVEAEGRKYLLYGPGASYPGMQRLEATGAPLGAWKIRLGRLYLPAEVDYRSVYPANGVRLLTKERLEGLLLLQQGSTVESVAVVDDWTTSPIIQVPGNNGRDMSTVTVVTVQGEEWLAKEAYRLRPASSLPQLDSLSVTLDQNGANRLFRLPAAPVRFTPPADGRVIVYDEVGRLVFDSFEQVFDVSLLPPAGYIRFVGAPGVTFKLEEAGPASGAAWEKTPGQRSSRRTKSGRKAPPMDGPVADKALAGEGLGVANGTASAGQTVPAAGKVRWMK